MQKDTSHQKTETVSWIIGLTDRRGQFLITFFKDKKSKTRCMVLPEFIVTKNTQEKVSLEPIKEYFECGEIRPSNRSFGKRGRAKKENLQEFSVSTVDELKNIIIPFFKKHILKTYKKDDLILFEKIVNMISKGVHLDNRGVNQIFRIAQDMSNPPARVLK